MHAGRPRTISEFKENISEEIKEREGDKPRSVCKDVLDYYALLLNKCTELNGGHL